MILKRKKGAVCRNNDNDSLMLETGLSDSKSVEKFNSYADFIMELVEKNSEARGIDGKQAARPEMKKEIILDIKMIYPG